VCLAFSFAVAPARSAGLPGPLFQARGSSPHLERWCVLFLCVSATLQQGGVVQVRSGWCLTVFGGQPLTFLTFDGWRFTGRFMLFLVGR